VADADKMSSLSSKPQKTIEFMLSRHKGAKADPNPAVRNGAASRNGRTSGPYSELEPVLPSKTPAISGDLSWRLTAGHGAQFPNLAEIGIETGLPSRPGGAVRRQNVGIEPQRHRAFGLGAKRRPAGLDDPAADANLGAIQHLVG
jgi:hypothetical protein